VVNGVANDKGAIGYSGIEYKTSDVRAIPLGRKSIRQWSSQRLKTPWRGNIRWGGLTLPTARARKSKPRCCNNGLKEVSIFHSSTLYNSLKGLNAMKCPGQDRRYWLGSAVVEVPCPECGNTVEIFRDENSGHCRHCGHRFLNPGTDFGCAQWCSLANECLGYAPQRKSGGDAAESALAARLIQWLEQEFKGNPARIAQALRIFQCAKELARIEGGDPRVVLSAALLLASGVYNSEPFESSPGQIDCGPKTAAKLEQALKHARLDEDTAQRVSQILEKCRKGEKADAIEFQIVCDSQTLVGLAAQHFAGSSDEWENLIRTSLNTEAAKNIARTLPHTRPV
jgi:hypothetical protein